MKIANKNIHCTFRNGMVKLSMRQYRILEFMAHGFTSFQISQLTGMSLRTIEDHRSSLIKKFNARNSVELIVITIVHGIVKYHPPRFERQWKKPPVKMAENVLGDF